MPAPHAVRLATVVNNDSTITDNNDDNIRGEVSQARRESLSQSLREVGHVWWQLPGHTFSLVLGSEQEQHSPGFWTS